MFKVVCFLIGSFVILSCKTTLYKLNDEDIKWNPYKMGDSLIFKSNQGVYDTIYIKNVQKGESPNDNLGKPKYYYEWLFVGAESINNKKISTDYLILQVVNSPSGTGIDFNLILKNAQLDGDSNYYSTNYLKKMPIIKDPTIHDKYNDVFRLPILPKVDFVNQNNSINLNYSINAIYWSRSHGYIRFDLTNGSYWELIKKASFKKGNGVN